MTNGSRRRSRRKAGDGGLRFGLASCYGTGPDPAKDRLVEVGVVRVGPDTPPETRSWRIDPGVGVRRAVLDRSGLRQRDLSEAPPWDVIGEGEVRPFLTDLDLLFVHSPNRELDWFRDEILAPGRPRPEVVDLLSLVRYFLGDLPVADGHAREAAADSGSEPAPERRMPAVLAGLLAAVQRMLGLLLPDQGPNGGGHLLLSLLTRAVEMGTPEHAFGALLRVANEAHGLRWSATDEIAYPRPDPVDVALLDRAQILARLRTRIAAEPAGKPKSPTGDELRLPSEEGVQRAFEALERGIPHFRPRSAQREFAEYIVSALKDGGFYAIEAGTGTGKTLGYLVPGCELLRLNPGAKVLVATATKNLQNQVALEELPKLLASVPAYRGLEVAVLKGKANYLCDSALLDLYEETFGLGAVDGDRQVAWLYLLLLAQEQRGDFDQIAADVLERWPAVKDLRDEVNAFSSCTQESCAGAAVCSFAREGRAAWAADLVVTNQHKLPFVGELLQSRVVFCVVDEADELPDNLRSAQEAAVSDAALRRLVLSRLRGGRKRRGMVESLKRRWEAERGTERDPDQRAALDRCLNALHRIDDGLDLLERALATARPASLSGASASAVRWALLGEGGEPEALAAAIREVAQLLIGMGQDWKRVAESGRYGAGAADDGSPSAQASTPRGAERISIEKQRELLARLGAEAALVASEFPSPDFVHTVRVADRWWEARRTPIDLAEGISQVFPFPTTVFTSATLSVDGTLDLFERELCLPEPLEGNWLIPSEFDYHRNVLGAVTGFLPAFRFRDPPERKRYWIERVAATIAALSVAIDGRTLVLFTSRREMREVFDRIRPILVRHDIEALVQEGASVAEIQTFRQLEHSVLFGVDRFWKGVDFPGPTLSQVIVVRLPNPGLSDPVIEHRMEQMGDTFWEDYYHPVTRLKLKQGFGRLIRTETDRGVFVVLDRRLVADPRMAPMQEELPIRLEVFPEWRNDRHEGDLFDLVTRALQRMGLFEEFEDRGVDVYAL